MKTIIPKLIFAGAAFAAAMCFDAPASFAYGDAPWCAVLNMGTGDVVWDCEYRTVEECVPNVLGGNRGFCNLNPWPGPSVARVARYKHHKRYVRH